MEDLLITKCLLGLIAMVTKTHQMKKLYMENISPIPLTKKDKDFQKRIDRYKNNLNLINRAPLIQ